MRLRRDVRLERDQASGGLHRAHERSGEQFGLLRVGAAVLEERHRRGVMVGDQRRVAALELRLSIQQAQDRAVGRAVVEAEHLEQRVDERVQRRAVRWLVAQQLLEAADLLGVPVEDQVLLAREVPEDRPRSHPRRLRDLFDRRLRVPLLEEQPVRRGDDLRSRACPIAVAQRGAGVVHERKPNWIS